jgi:hypothetical protein
MKKSLVRSVLFSGLFLLVLFFALERRTPTADRLLLLVPDGTDLASPPIKAWTDAGDEEGLHVVPIHDSDFLRPILGQSKCAGLILPDSVHRQASDLVVASVKRFVAGGGKLMLVYDAATLSSEGRYPFGSSRLSDLAGVKYALYDDLRDKMIRWNALQTTSKIIHEFDVPPGKYYPFQSSLAVSSDTEKPNPGFEVQLRRYKFGDLEYPNFVTAGQYAGTELFRSTSAVVAGTHPYGKGLVLFVNLPLGYLKTGTDGLPLHMFLKYFASSCLSLPYLMSVPDGKGGLVLNWHVDSNAAIGPLQEMNSWSLLKQGPYSVHITAGPDAVHIGDQMGVNAEHNPVIQALIHKYIGLGYTIGSHGGWIHNYFAAHIDIDSPQYMQQFLALNQAALEHAAGKRVVEYSAPDGNQPLWVTHWLEAHGFIAYYFTGDTGMGPTEGYRNGERSGHNIWAFPILHLDRAAAFEEFGREGYSDAEVEAWLNSVTSFVAGHHVARLIYFHPPGIIHYHSVIDRWLELTAQLKASEQFRWYTMTDLATFLNSRKSVRWNSSTRDGIVTINAQHPTSLQHMTWWLPADRFERPSLVKGEATILQTGTGWMVVAGDVRSLQITAKII